MSAFLKFSQGCRTKVKESNPDMSNTDVSRLLGEMWRNASPADRAPYVEQEVLERAQYKKDIQKFREKQEKLDEESFKKQKAVQKAQKPPPQASQTFEHLHYGHFNSYGATMGGRQYGNVPEHVQVPRPPQQYPQAYSLYQQQFPPIPGTCRIQQKQFLRICCPNSV